MFPLILSSINWQSIPVLTIVSMSFISADVKTCDLFQRHEMSHVYSLLQPD